MPPKIEFPPAAQLEAALNLVNDLGIEKLTARNLAKRMNSSVAPLYRCFRSMNELKYNVMLRVRDMLIEYTRRQYSDHIFLDMVTGIVLFARDFPNLYEALFLKGNEFQDILIQFLESLRDRIPEDEQIPDLSEERRFELMQKMWIFTHGLASLMCAGLLEDRSDDFVIRYLSEAAEAIVSHEIGEEVYHSLFKQEVVA